MLRKKKGTLPQGNSRDLDEEDRKKRSEDAAKLRIEDATSISRRKR